MFKRRTPHTKLQHLRELCWPSMGWRRAIRYVRLRVTRMSDSTQKIAAGLALGISISFTPILGTHFIQAGLLAWLFRLNIVAAIIGTFFANPWTIPFMWWGSLQLGAWIFSFLGVRASTNLPPHMDFHIFWDLLTHEPVRILLPLLTGGYLLAFAVFLPSFALFYYMVQGAKAARIKVRLRKVHKAAVEVTGQDR